MEYYPAALSYIIIDKEINLPKKRRFRLTVEQRRSFITRILEKLNRTFFFVDDYVVDITADQNNFANQLKIDPANGNIISMEYTNEKEYLVVPKSIVVDLIKTNPNDDDNANIEDSVNRICANTKNLSSYRSN